jgi:hypothetical protein
VENIANTEIWTVDGRIVRRGMGNSMDVSQLPDGVYVVKIHTDNQIVTRKIMISK